MADFELRGMEAMLAALRAIPDQVIATTPGALARAGHLVEANVKLELSRTSHPPGTPTPSRPGQPPSLISGTLRRSVLVDGPRQLGPASWRVKTGTGLVYSRIQELGGWAGRGHRSYLPPRPYMRPALMSSLPGIAALMERAWADAID